MFKLIKNILKTFIILFIIYVLLCTFPFFSMPFEDFLGKVWEYTRIIAGTIYRMIRSATG